MMQEPEELEKNKDLSEKRVQAIEPQLMDYPSSPIEEPEGEQPVRPLNKFLWLHFETILPGSYGH